MKQIVFPLLLLGAVSQAAGCIITTDDGDDDGPAGTTAQFGVAWTLDGGCGATGTTIQLVSDDKSGAAPFEDLYDCVDSGSADTRGLPLGTYDVYINVLDDAGTRLASSFATSATLGTAGEIVSVPEFAFATDGGFMTLTWAILNDADDTALACTDVGADAAAIVATITGGGGPGGDDCTTDPNCYPFEWDCEGLAGTTTKMPLAEYAVAVDILNVEEEALNPESATATVTLDYGNEHEDLGNFDFAFALSAQ